MKVFYSDTFVLPLPEGHRFPMRKYSMLRERVERELEALVELVVPHAATEGELVSAHDPEYVRRVRVGGLTASEMRRIGFPWSPEMVERSRRSVGATIEACRAALEEGYAANLAGGTHHAFRDRGEGFCVFNDGAVAARTVRAEGLVERVVIVDADVHQGNGTASILEGDSSVFTFSVHGAKNFPFEKERSDLDVELPDGADDGEYLEAFERGLLEALERADAGLAVYLAGADPYEGDRLGRLALSKAGLGERDRLFFEHARAAGLPVAITMSGGYARSIEDTVDIHFSTVRRAAGLAAAERARSGEVYE
ncbi:histone deacetylase [Rubrobacter taiwanensis]|jgi:acetoin utilization deacetylase AcuC-like enzyme|uniref:Histone deacetylase n=1 Tax=Rubrobacter taiwanensis TaxID=185139 RepID=A0A4R1BQ80_9ACTN|nr:histone deacetylase [Rubrobacter taiwanensis]TCJ19447.1 histone deacetylase [Rubrobacter taiwanensis]